MKELYVEENNYQLWMCNTTVKMSTIPFLVCQFCRQVTTIMTIEQIK